MVASNSMNSRRIAVLAAALASAALPGAAWAGPGWRNAEGREHAREERGGDNRQARSWHQPPPPPQQQQQQAPSQPRQQPDWANRGGSQTRVDGDPRQHPRPIPPAGQADNRQTKGLADRHKHDDRRDGGNLGSWRPRIDSYHRHGSYGGHPPRPDHRWDHHWRDNRRYDWHAYRRSHPSFFQVGVYFSPYRDFRYQRLRMGYFLDSQFFGSRYWIKNPSKYRLPDVYGPYRWVRYYNDAVLVDTDSGEVVDLIYAFFW